MRFPGHAHNNLAVSLGPGEVRRSLQMALSEVLFSSRSSPKVKRLQKVEQSSEGSKAWHFLRVSIDPSPLSYHIWPLTGTAQLLAGGHIARQRGQSTSALPASRLKLSGTRALSDLPWIALVMLVEEQVIAKHDYTVYICIYLSYCL